MFLPQNVVIFLNSDNKENQSLDYILISSKNTIIKLMNTLYNTCDILKMKLVREGYTDQLSEEKGQL